MIQALSGETLGRTIVTIMTVCPPSQTPKPSNLKTLGIQPCVGWPEWLSG